MCLKKNKQTPIHIWTVRTREFTFDKMVDLGIAAGKRGVKKAPAFLKEMN
jgi:hypothetical protein